MSIFINGDIQDIYFNNKKVLGVFKKGAMLYPSNLSIEEDNENEYFYFKIHNRLQTAEVGFESYLFSGKDGGNTEPTVDWNSFTKYVAPTLEYSFDKITWNQYILGTPITIGRGQLGDIIYFRGDNLDPWMDEYQQTVTETNTRDDGSTYDFKYTHTFRVWTHAFTNNAQVQCNGNIMSLRYKSYQNQLTLPCDYTFSALFSNCSNLLRGPVLPATTLKPYCYIHLFLNSGITIAPTLPATTMQERCYGGMFAGSKITTPPELPATTLAIYCYGHVNSPYTRGLSTWIDIDTSDKGSSYCGMFSDSMISIAPTLPAIDLAEGCYRSMFSDTNISTPPILPSTNLADRCYSYMFYRCNLTTAPVLPATTLKLRCYEYMFASNHKLATPPKLPATTCAEYCYYHMFEYSGLTTAPLLPATVLAEYCYAYMFSNTNITTPPSLPATTLKDYCYEDMFSYTNITIAPVLPATVLVYHCYDSMFYRCAQLITPPSLPATTLASYCYNRMFAHSGITIPPTLPATTLESDCYSYMFSSCKKLTKLPRLNATTLSYNSYQNMFNSSNAIASTTKTNVCTYSYRVPYSGTGTDNTYKSGVTSMFSDASGNDFTPTINTTFYVNLPS